MWDKVCNHAKTTPLSLSYLMCRCPIQPGVRNLIIYSIYSCYHQDLIYQPAYSLSAFTREKQVAASLQLKSSPHSSGKCRNRYTTPYNGAV